MCWSNIYGTKIPFHVVSIEAVNFTAIGESSKFNLQMKKMYDTYPVEKLRVGHKTYPKLFNFGSKYDELQN